MSQDDLNQRLQVALSEGTANLSRTLMGMKVHTGYTHAGGPRPRPLGRSAALCRHAVFFVCLFLMRFLSSSVVTLWAYSGAFSFPFCRHALGPQCVVFCPLLSSRFGPTVGRFLSSSVVTLWAHSVGSFLSPSVVTLWAHSVGRFLSSCLSSRFGSK